MYLSFPAPDKFSVRFAEAQNLFADALGKLHEPAEAAKLADKALAVAIDVSEQLANFHGELLISRRRAANGFVKHIFGCRVEPSVQNEKYKEALASDKFDYCVLPMSWKQLSPQENVFAPEGLDEWVEAMARNRIPTIAGPLIRLDQDSVPDWMVIWEHDFDMLREMTYDFVQKVVTRFRKHVAAWNVVAGVETNGAFALTFEQIIELTRLLVSQVKTLIPNARTMITITHPFGEYHARSKASVPPMLYAEMVAQAGISFEAFALEIEMGVPEPGNFTRDLFQLSSMLDKFSTLGRPVFITAVGVPGRATPDAGKEPPIPPPPAAGTARGIHSSRPTGWKRSITWPSASPSSKASPGPTSPISNRPCPAGACSTTCSAPSLLSRDFSPCAKSTASSRRSDPAMLDEAPGSEFPWSARHRRALILLMMVFVVVCAVRCTTYRATIDDPQPQVPARAADLGDRLDPNTATWQELAAISGLGEKRARAIVAYRERWQHDHPSTPAFSGPQDLRNIKGIGPATVSNMSPFLTFPDAGRRG